MQPKKEEIKWGKDKDLKKNDSKHSSFFQKLKKQFLKVIKVGNTNSTFQKPYNGFNDSTMIFNLNAI